MEINGAMNAGLQGLQRASQQVNEASAEIANAGARNEVQQQGNAQANGVNAATESASETGQSVAQITQLMGWYRYSRARQILKPIRARSKQPMKCSAQ